MNRSGAQSAVKKLIDQAGVLIQQSHGTAGHRLSRELSCISRIKVGRLRLFYICTPQADRAILLYIGNRKAGDSNDPYECVSKLLAAGKFDGCFKELGLSSATQAAPPHTP